jgi:hypothetical protein
VKGCVVTEWEALYRQAMTETDRTKLRESIEIARSAINHREREISQTLVRIMQEQLSIREAKHSLELLAREGIDPGNSDVA